jgi:hypothetical protein
MPILVVAKLTRKQKTMALLFGRLRYCKELFNDDVTVDNFLRNFYLFERSLDGLISLISVTYGAKHTHSICTKIVYIIDITKESIKPNAINPNNSYHVNPDVLFERWASLKLAICTVMLEEPDDVTKLALTHQKKIESDQSNYLKFKILPYLVTS